MFCKVGQQACCRASVLLASSGFQTTAWPVMSLLLARTGYQNWPPCLRARRIYPSSYLVCQKISVSIVPGSRLKEAPCQIWIHNKNDRVESTALLACRKTQWSVVNLGIASLCWPAMGERNGYLKGSAPHAEHGGNVIRASIFGEDKARQTILNCSQI